MHPRTLFKIWGVLQFTEKHGTMKDDILMIPFGTMSGGLN